MAKDGGGNLDDLFKDLSPDGDENPEILKIIELKKKGRSLRQIAGEINKSKEYVRLKLMDAGIKTGFDDRTSTRPREITPVLLFDDATIGYIISFPFNYLAQRFGDFWLLSKDEEKQISDLSNKVASKWVPNWLKQYSEEIALISFSFALVYPRYLQTKILSESLKIKPKKEDQKQD